MTTPELLQLMRLLSALESWSFAEGKTLPDYLHDQLVTGIEVIEREILKGTNEHG
jgi:hypothetical protein